MAKASIDRDGVFKVVDGYDLERSTERGWRLVEILRESDVSVGTDEELHPQFVNHDYGSGSYYGGDEKVRLDKAHVVERSRFLLRKDPDSAIAEVVDEMDEMESRVSGMERERKAALERVGVVESQLGTLLRQVEEKNRQVERANTECAAARDQRLKIEADLAKVRQAVGELKMKEILAGEE